MKTQRLLTIALIAASFVATSIAPLNAENIAYPKDYDIVVYGGTSGGITAAVAAAKMGKKVALVSPTARLGGLTTNGLGFTDLGKNQIPVTILGGLSEEFYHRIYLYYAAQPNWNTVKLMKAQHIGNAFDQTRQLGYIFEPKVARLVFDQMLAETGVEIFTGLLDLTNGVVMDGQRITAMKLEDGRMFHGKMFIDAGYEGDLLAGAGVSFTVGRESSATYGEINAGVLDGPSTGGVAAGFDPYIVKGNPASGLLPGINATIAPNGTGDGRFQAYCFRMCLSNVPANRVMVAQPANYNEADLEMIIREVELGTTAFLKNDLMPNGKTDTNNTGGVSTDYIGRNYGDGWNWSTLNHAQRAALSDEHKYWQLGIIWTLQNHPRVLAKVPGGLYPEWGLAADEFTENGSFPPQLYVREARRMVSDYVMTKQNAQGEIVAEDPVGMGAYTLDSHHTQRFVKNGAMENEGSLNNSEVPAPYPISYRSMIPKSGECENLLVPWCVSASHVAFGSIRMEPVFMTLGQSAATAASMAINDGVSVQQLSYEKLAAKLRADGVPLKIGTDTSSINPIILDNTDPGAVTTGAWTTTTATAGFYGSNYLHDGNTAQGTKSVSYTPVIPTSGNYNVALRWTAQANRASNVPVKITHRDGTFTTTVNQRANGGIWVPLGTFYFDAGSSGNLLIETTGANGFVIADAAQWILTSALPVVEIIATVPNAVRGGGTPAEFVFTRSGDTTAALTAYYTTSGTVTLGEYSPSLSGSITFPANVREAKISRSALQGLQPLGPRALQLNVSNNAAYQPGPLASATVTFRDNPFDAWRFANFNSTQLGNPLVSGAGADPNGNGVKNLMEFFTGGSFAHAPTLSEQDGILRFMVRRHQDAQDLKMTVWESEDLANWTRIPAPSSPPWFVRNGDFQDLIIPVKSGDPFAEGRRFFQLEIEE